MRTTANYNLNQWDPSDRVLRENFNNDNQKIDAALTKFAQKNNFEKLGELVLSSKVNSVSINVSGIDWKKYAIVMFVCHLKGFGDGLFCPNNDKDKSRYGLDRFTELGGIGMYSVQNVPATLILFPYGDDTFGISGIFAGALLGHGYSTIPYASFSALHLNASASHYTLDPGSRITILGLKA